MMTFPFWLAVYLKCLHFQTVACLVSLFPGVPGLWIRRAFYYMTLKNSPRDLSVNFGAVVLQRDVEIGPACSIGGWCTINHCRIGKGVLIGTRIDVFSGKNQHGNIETLAKPKVEIETIQNVEPTLIGDNVWIGNGSIVFADVGTNSIVGAGSVVVKPIPANCIAAGNPARVLKQASY